MVMANKFTQANFSLAGYDVADIVKGVDSFNYMGHLLHRSDDNLLAFLKIF